MMNRKRSLGVIAAGSALLLMTACAGGPSEPDADADPLPGIEDLDALVAAAQDEGQLVFYSSQAEAINDALGAAFEDEYGIKVLSTKMLGGEVGVKFQAEATAGQVQADAIMPACTEKQMFVDIVEQGFATAASDLGIPLLEDDAYAANIVNDGSSLRVGLLPVVMGYNTDVLSEADAPKTWEDLLDPKYKGRIVMVAPDTSAFYMHFLQFLDEQFGDEYLEALTAQDLQFADSATARNQLSAGQAIINIPTMRSAMQDSVDSGAPVESIDPDTTSAVEICVGVASETSAPHPAAAKLFGYFLTTPEAAAAFESVPGVVSPFSETGLPESIKPLPEEVPDPEALLQLLGL